MSDPVDCDFGTEESLAWLATRFSLAGTPIVWSRFSTGALLLALEAVPFEARRREEEMAQLREVDPMLRLFYVGPSQAAETLREALAERGVR